MIAVSQATKKDLVEVSNIPEEKIRVIYEGPSADFTIQPKAKIEAFRKKYHLPQKFVLAIGGVGERRNLKRIKEATLDYGLVIAGQTVPWLSLEELELLYQSASVLVYASLYEGFGIPILDAYLCGLPVITSNVSSMPEVGGDACLYVDPLNTDDIAKMIEIVMEDKSTRQGLIKKGFAQAKKFSWQKAALETAEIYRKLVQK